MTRKPPQNRWGFVYVIRCYGGIYKIGRSKDPFQRIKTIQAQTVLDCRLIHIIGTNDMWNAEEHFHFFIEKDEGPALKGREWWRLGDGTLDWLLGHDFLWSESHDYDTTEYNPSGYTFGERI